MSRFGISYHDNTLGEKPEPLFIEPVTDGESVTANQGPYYRLRIGYDLTIFISEARLRELGRRCLEAPPLTSVNAPDATQSEDCATAQAAVISDHDTERTERLLGSDPV